MAEPPPPYTAAYPPQTQASPGYPQQPGYPPQQPGYPPQQPGYPPQQPGYPSKQPDFSSQQPGYPPPQPYVAQPAFQPSSQVQTSNTTVVLQQQPGVVLMKTSLGNCPTAMQCPFCSATITTSLNYIDGTMVWLVAGVLCFVGCWPCCLIPFCADDCKDVQHSCPNCHNVVGTFRRM